MGIEFKLTDSELPASPAFVAFLDRFVLGTPTERAMWPDQTAETLARASAGERKRIIDLAARVMADAGGRERVARAYSLLIALMIGNVEELRALQSRFGFVCVVGIPRTGGSYLTAEIYRSVGIAPHDVPDPVAHDSFPDARPFELASGTNSWISTLKTTAEYLVMVEVFFSAQPGRGGKVIVPKKLTQAAYCGDFFQRVLGPDTDFVLTVRHPVAACVSTYEKSGGLPDGGRFAVRSNIEEWCRRDLAYAGCDAMQLQRADYFDAYLRYWEQYHLLLAMSGLTSRRRVVPYGSSSLQSAAQYYHELHGSGLRASEFLVSDKARRLRSDWIERSQPAIERVVAAWKRRGLEFPREELEECL